MTAVTSQAPGGLPLLGHLPVLMLCPLPFLASLPGSGDVVRIRLGSMSAYAVTHPELVRQVLVTDAHAYKQGRMHEKLAVLFKTGLAAASGEVHVRRRRLLQRAFQHDRIDGYLTVMRSATETMMDSWRPGQTLVVDQVMNELGLAAIAKSIFSAEMGARSAAAFQRSLPIVFKAAMARVFLPAVVEKLPTPGNRRYARALSDITSAVSETISAYRSSGQDHGDIFSVMLAARDEAGRGLTDEEIRDNAISFMSGGLETTAAALAWAFHELGRHPEMERRLHAELDEVLDGRNPELGDLPRLAYTGRFITETLRLHAPWILMRRTQRPVQLGEVTLPENTEIIISPYMLTHDPRWFAEPHRFDPDRWLPDAAKRLPKCANIPFSAGAHKCIGDDFVVTELTVVLAMVCSRWRLRPRPGRRVRETVRATVHPDRVEMILDPRTAVHERTGASERSR